MEVNVPLSLISLVNFKIIHSPLTPPTVYANHLTYHPDKCRKSRNHSEYAFLGDLTWDTVCQMRLHSSI